MNQQGSACPLLSLASFLDYRGPAFLLTGEIRFSIRLDLQLEVFGKWFYRILPNSVRLSILVEFVTVLEHFLIQWISRRSFHRNVNKCRLRWRRVEESIVSFSVRSGHIHLYGVCGAFASSITFRKHIFFFLLSTYVCLKLHQFLILTVKW